MQSKEIHPLLLSGKLGDGGFARNRTHRKVPDSSIAFVSINLDYIQHKWQSLREYRPGKINVQKSGYKVGATSFRFATRQHPDVTYVEQLSNAEAVQMLTRESFIYYYLDDGTYHQRKHFMHLYCNTFEPEAVEALIARIADLYPVKPSALRWDRKSDGRAFPYLYIPVATAKEVAADVRDFLTANAIPSLLYKAGVAVPPSETIESGVCVRESEAAEKRSE